MTKEFRKTIYNRSRLRNRFCKIPTEENEKLYKKQRNKCVPIRFNPEGLKLFSLTSSHGFSQLMRDPTHIQANSSSCVDLVFTDQPNLSVTSGVHASLPSPKLPSSNCSF